MKGVLTFVDIMNNNHKNLIALKELAETINEKTVFDEVDKAAAISARDGIRDLDKLLTIFINNLHDIPHLKLIREGDDGYEKGRRS